MEKTAMFPPPSCPSPRAGQIGSKAVVERRQEVPPGRSASVRARKSFPKIRKTVMMLMLMMTMMLSVPGQHSGEESRTRWCYCTRRTAEDSSVHKQRASSGSSQPASRARASPNTDTLARVVVGPSVHSSVPMTRCHRAFPPFPIMLPQIDQGLWRGSGFHSVLK